MRIKGIRGFYPAHPTNYWAGRAGHTIKYFTVHHTAGWESTLRYLWANSARNGSSTLFVGQGYYEQYVDTNDAPWTNGNATSNRESITCEVRGDWRGYHDQTTLNTLQEAMYQCLKTFPNLQLTFHMDVSRSVTLCPADLKHKGYAVKEWNKAKARIEKENSPTPVPPVASKITYEKITPKRVLVKQDGVDLWNFNFTKWGDARAVNPKEFENGYPKGHSVDIVSIATNALGGRYYMTAYSYNSGKIRATNGFNVADVIDYVPPKPTIPAPTPKPVWVAMDKPRSMKTDREMQVINLDTMKAFGDVIPKGKLVGLVEKKTMNDGKLYVRTQWSKNNSKNWGLPFDSMIEVSSSYEPPVETTPPAPIDVDPKNPSDSDVITRLTILEKTVKAIVDFLQSIFKNFKKG